MRNRRTVGLAAALSVAAAGIGLGLVPLRAVAATASPVDVTFTAKDNAFVSPPSSIRGGLTKVTLKNTGKEVHGVQLALVQGSHTKAEVTKIVTSESGPIPSWIVPAGGIAEVKGGTSASVIVNLRKGSYVFWSDASNDQKGTSDLGAGMYGTMAVTTDKAAAEPTAPASIVAKEYGFEISGLKAGKNTVAFLNAGKEIHHVVMFPMLPGKTIADVQAFLSADPNAKNAPPPPVSFEQGSQMSVIDSGRAEVVDLNLPAGRWAFACFMNDRAGGPPHIMKGMLKEVLIK